MKTSVSAIVPVYDEEKTVSQVVEALLASPLVDEVIAVNDGSRDRSAEILRGFGDRIVFLNSRRNRGKGFALARGVKKAQGEIVTFWDADLSDLQDRHIEKVLDPLLEEEARVAIGHRMFLKRYGPKRYGPNPVSRRLSGQRAYHRKDLLPHLKEIAKTRFGVEVYLNAVLEGAETAHVHLPGLKAPLQQEKYGGLRGTGGYVRSGLEITKTLAKLESARLNRDWELLQEALKNKNSSGLRRAAERIENPQLRQFLNDYLNKYLRIDPKKKKNRSR